MKHAILLAIGLGVCAAAAALPRIPQDSAYHVMADQRTIAGVANAFDVASNLPFLVVGVAGIATLLLPLQRRGSRTAQTPWFVFFTESRCSAPEISTSAQHRLSAGFERTLVHR